MCCWLAGITGRLKTQEVKCLVSERQETRQKKLDHVMDKCKQEQNYPKQEQNYPTLLAVGQSMSAPKKGPLGGAGLLDT